MPVVSLVKSTRRGNSSRKRPLWLPIIAPKDDTTSFSLNLPDPARTKVSRPRVRFPPRSRTGCWTCRSRKVKCDESHPQCNQCTRLGHICDYRPRLCFRDDTRRIMDRMSEVEIVGNVVWDPDTPRTHKRPINTSADCLPSFELLTSDEDRERKAESSVPGTYHVIVIPESFAHLPEYTEDTPETYVGDQVSYSFCINSETSQSCVATAEVDPNVVILKVFRDTRRPSPINRKCSGQPLESDSRGSPVRTPSTMSSIQVMAHDNQQARSQPQRRDDLLLRHFCDVVWTHLIPKMVMVDCPGSSYRLSPEVFEQEAARSPRLYYAMLAISALSLSRQGSGHSVDAPQYYHRALAAVQTHPSGDDDLLSDEVLLTHFLLLVYEVAAANLDGLQIQSYVTSRLLHIVHSRQSTYGIERYPFILWWVCYIDVYNLLGGTGTGEFAKAVIEGHLLPTAESFFCPVSPETSCLLYPEERDNLFMISRLHHDTLMLAVRSGLFAADMRKHQVSYPDAHMDARQGAEELRNQLRGLWFSPEMRFLMDNRHLLQERLQYLLQQTLILFHTSFLFSFTGLWPERLSAETPAVKNAEEEIQHHAAMVLELAEDLGHAARENHRHIVIFPVFLAGTAVTSSRLKIRAWELLSGLEEEELGYHASSTCHQLQLEYERQMRQTRSGPEEASSVDWIELLAGRGSTEVHYAGGGHGGDGWTGRCVNTEVNV
ncbi:hypothetical protein P170DRAFT_466345 [Aspergillus steynii IBT 23096]|uniref:Zn(2)-C6 fungal-type domain-containing protein n=1 Tax=Aspergillus steynii IBT 23096 TaxID=1392250 RepID=A0A2I2G275_9EURO|nr:uncharacterized protein P170DRAFT_466345 [Aspergillus steynii IBT 23096]PLB46978.1 hypothetical protein P170DRAFT_466345 [Aspergillus steynii IBT 23096]